MLLKHPLNHLLIALAACCLMSACASGVRPTPEWMPQPALTLPKVMPQELALLPPRPLPQPANGEMLQLERNHRQVAKMYHELAAQVCSLLLFLERPCPAPTKH